VIPICDLKKQFEALREPMLQAVTAVFESGHFINGPSVKALENEVAGYLGAPHTVALNSGTDALHLALRALDIGAGDEVITTPFTFVATTEAIGIVGATPVFVDIESATYNIDPEQIEAAITPRTRAILPIHLYGNPAPMPEILQLAQKYGLAVIEDCAQAIGARIGDRFVGTFGTFGAFSFFPSKNLGAYGDGGMLVTADSALADRVRSLRGHGGRVKYHHEELGVNSRLDEVQAAILRVKLPHLESWIERRRAVAAHYQQGLQASRLTLPAENAGTRHAYHQYTVRVDERSRIAVELRSAGIETMVYYPVPLHLQKVHESLGYGPGSFPNAERASEEVLSLPMFPELLGDDQSRVIATLLALSPRRSQKHAEPIGA
jgi:dTDP-4-amino-4,6-dideoxygalactose transaminase